MDKYLIKEVNKELQKQILYWKQPVEYLEDRRISLETAIEAGCGFWPYDKGKTFLVSKFSLDESSPLASKMGCKIIDNFPGSISFPIYKNGELSSFVFRSCDPFSLRKHHNLKGSKYLFNEQAVKKERPLYITEGVFDCLSLLEIGYNAIATLGCNLTPEVIDKVCENPCRIYIVFDNDQSEIGQKAAKRFAFLCAKKGRTTSIVELPKPMYNKKTDVNDILVSGKEYKLREAVESSVVFNNSPEFLFGRMVKNRGGHRMDT